MSLLEDKIRTLPHSPGIYLMKDAKGKCIYVGKASDLQKRVAGYLHLRDQRYQVRFLMDRTIDLETILTDSEKEAFILENTLIKKYRPRYNIQLRDDKSYPSIKLSITDHFPRLYITRQIRKDGSLYFGPFSSASAARETVDFIEKYFRLRTCSDTEFRNRVRPCLQYQIHRCEAPCVGLIQPKDYQETIAQIKMFLQGHKKDLLKVLAQKMREQSDREEFEKAAQTRDLIGSIQETLEKQKVHRHQWIHQDVVSFYREGERVTFCVVLIREGKVWDSLLFHLSGQGENEEILDSFLSQFYSEERLPPDQVLVPVKTFLQKTAEQILTEKKGNPVRILQPQRGDKADLVVFAFKNAKAAFQHREKKSEETKDILAKLQESLELQNFPHRIECFDISNIGGQMAVGSLVSFKEGIVDKKNYKRFKIKTVNQANDFAMMKEVLGRRLAYLYLGKEGAEWERPDLIVIDGGKGQLNAVRAIFDELNITGIDLVSLAKEKEGENQDKIFLLGRKDPLLLGKNSNLLHLLMRVRDEAHRFAITYHRQLRNKNFLITK